MDPGVRATLAQAGLLAIVDVWLDGHWDQVPTSTSGSPITRDTLHAFIAVPLNDPDGEPVLVLADIEQGAAVSAMALRNDELGILKGAWLRRPQPTMLLRPANQKKWHEQERTVSRTTMSILDSLAKGVSSND